MYCLSAKWLAPIKNVSLYLSARNNKIKYTHSHSEAPTLGIALYIHPSLCPSYIHSHWELCGLIMLLKVLIFNSKCDLSSSSACSTLPELMEQHIYVGTSVSAPSYCKFAMGFIHNRILQQVYEKCMDPTSLTEVIPFEARMLPPLCLCLTKYPTDCFPSLHYVCLSPTLCSIHTGQCIWPCIPPQWIPLWEITCFQLGISLWEI